MVNKAIVIPSAILATIAVCMFIFICWWFPRAWSQGQASEFAEYDVRLRQERQLRELREAREARELAELEGNETGVTTSESGDAVPKPPPPTVQRPVGYVPPVTPY